MKHLIILIPIILFAARNVWLENNNIITGLKPMF